MTSVATRIFGILGLVAVFTGVLHGEAILIAGAVILLGTAGIHLSKADRADDRAGTEKARRQLSAGTQYRLRPHRRRGFLARNKT